MAKDYHDYVFKDGKLVGKFDEMYQESDDVPWHQDKVGEFPDIAVSKAILSAIAPFESLADIGCGLGFYLNELSTFVPHKKNLYGTDISPTAVQKAQYSFQEYAFSVTDLTKPDQSIAGAPGGVHMVVVRGFFWYVCDHMDAVVENIVRMVKPGGYLFIHQNFPPLDSTFVGKDVIPHPEALISFFTKYFTPLFRNEFRITEKNTNDHWVSVLFSKS